MFIDNLRRDFCSTVFTSTKDAYNLLVDRLEEADWHVATSQQDIAEYTFADDEHPVHEGEDYRVRVQVWDGDEIISCEFLIKEYYSDPGSVDYAYVIDVFEDGEFKFSSIR